MNIQNLKIDLRRLGFRRGDRLFVHSSFKSLGLAGDKPEAVVAMLKEVVGPRGTLGMPVFPWCFAPDHPFDPNTSPSKVGILTEVFRRSADVKRSFHPSHSVAFWGRDAEYLASGHAEMPPYALAGPFGKMYDLNFKIVMLGCGLAPNSTLHAIEDWARLPYGVQGRATCHCLSDPDHLGHAYQAMPVGHREFYEDGEASLACKYAKLLQQRNKLHFGKVGAAPVHWMEARDLVDECMSELDAKPDLFLCDDPKCSSCRVNKAELEVWKRHGGTRWDWVRLGRDKANITPGIDTWTNQGYGPGVPCEGILDDLHARVFVFRKKWRKWVLVTLDLLQTPREVAEAIKARISKRNHIPVDQIAICCSHTHTGPAIGAARIWKQNNISDRTYIEGLAVKISGAVHAAAREAIPITIGFDREPVDIGGINRRVRLANGAYKYYTMQEPLTPNGPVARDFGMIYFKDGQGQLVAGLGHYSCHPIFVAPHLRKISADYPGVFAATVENQVGGNCLIGFLQGTLGNQMPLKYWSGGQQAAVAGKKLAYCFLRGVHRHGGRPLKEVAFSVLNYRIKMTSEKSLITPIQGILLGEVGLGLIGAEIFIELGVRFQRTLASKKCLLVNLANDELGYLPHRQAFRHPTYEVRGCMDWVGGRPGIGEELIDVCATLVRKQFENNRSIN
ncbi:MAG: AAC(3) family N-acetyltransferase [Verrucomicrobiae bacterium]|nr:AAC(3) family N-acetyltransferase [Verrucomicrobiae bacterium]